MEDGPGGLVGLIASLSGVSANATTMELFVDVRFVFKTIQGDEGSDVGALIGALTGVITNLLGVSLRLIDFEATYL